MLLCYFPSKCQGSFVRRAYWFHPSKKTVKSCIWPLSWDEISRDLRWCKILVSCKVFPEYNASSIFMHIFEEVGVSNLPIYVVSLHTSLVIFLWEYCNFTPLVQLVKKLLTTDFDALTLYYQERKLSRIRHFWCKEWLALKMWSYNFFS